MRDNFKFNCARRSGVRSIAPKIEECILAGDPFSAGSGGDAPDGGHTQFLDGVHTWVGSQLHLMSTQWQGSTTQLPSNISLFAAHPGGSVEVRAETGVRISTGLPAMPDMSADHTNGVEIAVGENQSISLERGLDRQSDQTILMSPALGIDIMAGSKSLSLSSLQEITLSVANGLSSITLGPSGIVIKGLVVQIN
jgi:hypothetical protein